jgi:hypothetical protein
VEPQLILIKLIDKVLLPALLLCFIVGTWIILGRICLFMIRETEETYNAAGSWKNWIPESVLLGPIMIIVVLIHYFDTITTRIKKEWVTFQENKQWDRLQKKEKEIENWDK